MCIEAMIKKLTWGYLLPVVCVCFVAPMGLVMINRIYGGEGEEVAKLSLVVLMFIIPICSVVWPIIMASDHISVKGNELFYVKNKIKLPEYLLSFVIFMILTVPVVYLAKELCDLTRWKTELYQLFCACLFLNGAYYMLIYATGNYMIANILTVGYVLYSVFTGQHEFNINLDDLNNSYMCGIFLVLGIIAYIYGTYLNDHYEKYV